MIFTAAGAEWRGAGLLDVPGHEPRPAGPGRAQRVDLQPQLRGPPGQGRSHPPGLRAGRRRHRRPRHPLLARRPGATQEDTVMDTFTTPHRRRRPAASQQRRHRPDHPGRLPQAGDPHRLRGRAVRRLARRPDFVLNNPAYAAGSVLVAGPDFGTGSSREHAVWALQNYGFRVVISSRFADIFRGNSGKAGLLAAQVDEKVVQRLWDLLEDRPGSDRSPSTSSRARCVPARAIGRDRGLLRHRRLHPVAAARGARRHRDHAGSRGRHHGLRSDPAVVQACHALSFRSGPRGPDLPIRIRVSTSIDAKIPKDCGVA